MTTQPTTPDGILNFVAQQVFDEYKYFTAGTANAVIANDAVDITSPVIIDAVNRNKIRESGASESSVTNNSMVMLFILGPGEPLVQPVNIGEIGLVNSLAGGTILGLGAKLNSLQTKDNLVTQRYRCNITVGRVAGV